MASQFFVGLIPLGIVGFLVLLIVLSLPFRRQRRFSLQLEVAAPREQVWDTYHTNPEDPRSAALHPETVSVKTDPDSPDMVEFVIDRSGGHRTSLLTVREQILEMRYPEIRVTRVVSAGGKPLPFGPDHLSRTEFAESPVGTRVTCQWRGETVTWWQYVNIWYAIRRYFRRLKRISESEVVDPDGTARRFPWKSALLSIMAFGSFVLWLGWIGALALAGILIVHEFGHWLAFRMSGHPAPRIMLIPFLGGIAVGNHPHKTRFDEAFCALMGPALSIVPVAVLLMVTAALKPPELTGVPGWFLLAQYLDAPQKYVVVTAALTLGVGALNALQMLPILPLDGGQVLRATIHSFSARWARRVLLAVAVLGVAGFAWMGDYVIAAVAALGGVGAWHMDTGPSEVRPMGALSLSVIAVAYTVTFTVHAGATIFGLWALGILPELVWG
jgi:Zn-dependent protease